MTLSTMDIKLTDVRQSQSKINYFNAVLNDGVEDKSVVCYKPQLHLTLESASINEKPVRLSNFTEKMDSFNHLNPSDAFWRLRYS